MSRPILSSPSYGRAPSRPGVRARFVAGAVSTATVLAMVAAPTANAQSTAPGSLAGSLTGSLDAGSLGSSGSSGSLGSSGAGPTTPPEDRYPTEPLPAGPEVGVEVLHSGLTIPWDVVRDPSGVVVTGERGTGRVVAIHPDGIIATVAADFGDLFTGGESGLMGMALASDFETTREVYTCHSQNFADGTPGDSRVTAWRAADDWSALEDPEVIVPGIARQNIGHHSGCRILAHPDGTLYIGTGDTFHGSIPQDLRSLGGKVLHVNSDGSPTRSPARIEGADPRIFTYGHRNVQGLALQPGTGRIFSAEHGTHRDDEINLLRAGGNYGWDPLRPGINERDHDDSSPMTDLTKFPDAIEATWSSGDPTLATSGATFLDDPSWGEWDGALAVAMLKTRQIALMKLDEEGTRVREVVAVIPGEHGRIRSLTSEPGGTILATTSNGQGQDKVLRIRPAVGG